MKIEINEDTVKGKLEKIINIYSSESLSDINDYLPRKERYKSKEQYCASKILFAFDGIIRDFSDPGNYILYISNCEAFPDELKNLIQDHHDKIINKRMKNPINLLKIKLYSEEWEKAKIKVNRRRKEEIEEKEKLNVELRRYRAIYRQTFEKMSIPKYYWWDRI